MRLLRRILAFALALVVVGLFYVFAVMLEGDRGKQDERFTVVADTRPLQAMQPLRSADANQLAEAFGVSLPLPEGFTQGQVEDLRYHGYLARKIQLQGSQALVTGIRPASAAPAIFPRDAVFVLSDKALLGQPLMQAQAAGRTIYALVQKDAAFLIEPLAEGQPGGFSQLEPRP